MKTFKAYYIERVANPEQAEALKSKVKELSQPGAVTRAIKELGAENIDDLIRKLEQDPGVRQVISKYQELKHKHPHVESFLFDEGILSGIWHALTGIFSWAINSVAKTIGHVLGGFKEAGKSKGKYAAALLVTFGLSGLLLATGAPTAVVVGSLPLTGTWWGLMWFGKNVLEPMFQSTDGV